MKKRVVYMSALFFSILLIMNISAGIYFSQLNEAYNMGDMIDLNVTIDPVKDSPLKIKLFCGGNFVDVFNGPAITNLKIPLNSFWIGNLIGNCYFSAEYSGETKKTNPEFKISKKLSITLPIDSFFAKPGETITLNGYVKRINGQGSNGEAELSFPILALMQQINSNSTNNNTNNSAIESSNQLNQENKGIFYGKITNGEFTIILSLPSNIAAGDYKINILAYEKSSLGEKINEGSAVANLKISQVLANIDFALNNQNFNPGETVTIKPVLLDQTGAVIHEQVSIIIVDKKSNRVFEKIARSEETAEYKIPTNQQSSYYTIKLSGGELNLSKNFYINEKAIASFELRNITLVIKNIGNIIYKKDIQIELNGKPFVKKVDLDLDESKEFILTGVEGDYDVKVTDGESEIKQGGVHLTGRMIGVSDSKEKSTIEKVSPLIWIFLIVILLGGFIFFFMNVAKKKSVAYPIEKPKVFGEKKPLKLDNVIKDEKKEKQEGQETVKKMPITLPKRLISPTEAEPGMVITGQRTRAAIIALKIKNKIDKNLKIVLQNAIEPIYENRGSIYEHGEFIIAILTTLVTHSPKNEVEALKAAEKVASRLKEHNNRFKDKIEFGIGVNSGEIINEIRDNKLIFTALGNSIISAKKLAEASSNEQVLLTKEAYERGISEIKAERKVIGELEVYELRKIADYEKNKKFIDEFLKRNERDNPGFRNQGFKNPSSQNSGFKSFNDNQGFNNSHGNNQNQSP